MWSDHETTPFLRLFDTLCSCSISLKVIDYGGIKTHIAFAAVVTLRYIYMLFSWDWNVIDHGESIKCSALLSTITFFRISDRWEIMRNRECRIVSLSRALSRSSFTILHNKQTVTRLPFDRMLSNDKRPTFDSPFVLYSRIATLPLRKFLLCSSWPMILNHWKDQSTE